MNKLFTVLGLVVLLNIILPMIFELTGVDTTIYYSPFQYFWNAMIVLYIFLPSGKDNPFTM